MAKSNNLCDFLTDLADALRSNKVLPSGVKDSNNKINPQNFRTAIEGSVGKNVAAAGHTVSASITTVNGEGNVDPGTISIADNSTAVSGKSRIAVTPSTGTSGISKYYIASKATAAANNNQTFPVSGSNTTGAKDVVTAGYCPGETVTGGVSGSGTATANVKTKDSSVYYSPVATIGLAASGSVTVSGEGSVDPGNVTVAADSTAVTGKTRIAVTPSTATSGISTYYIAVKPSAAAGTATNIPVSGTGTASASVTSSGYGTKDTETGTGSVTGSGNASVNAAKKDGSVHYLPIASAALSNVTVDTSSTSAVPLVTTTGYIEKTKYMTALTIPAFATLTTLTLTSGVDGNRTTITTENVNTYTTVSNLNLFGIISTLTVGGGYISTLNLNNANSYIGNLYGTGHVTTGSGKTLAKYTNSGTLTELAGAGGITTWSGTGTITNKTGNSTITTNKATLTVTNNGTSDVDGYVNVLSNNGNSTVRLGGTTDAAATYRWSTMYGLVVSKDKAGGISIESDTAYDDSSSTIIGIGYYRKVYIDNRGSVEFDNHSSGVISDLQGSGAITKWSGTGTVTDKTGNSTITNNKSTISITNNGDSSNAGAVNITTNTYGTIRIGGTVNNDATWRIAGTTGTLTKGKSATVSTEANTAADSSVLTVTNAAYRKINLSSTGSSSLVTLSDTINELAGNSKTITTFSGTGTITNNIGTKTITNNGTSSTAGILNVTTNTYGIVCVNGSAVGDKVVYVEGKKATVDGVTVTDNLGDLKEVQATNTYVKYTSSGLPVTDSDGWLRTTNCIYEITSKDDHGLVDYIFEPTSGKPYSSYIGEVTCNVDNSPVGTLHHVFGFNTIDPSDVDARLGLSGTYYNALYIQDIGASYSSSMVLAGGVHGCFAIGELSEGANMRIKSTAIGSSLVVFDSSGAIKIKEVAEDVVLAGSSEFGKRAHVENLYLNEAIGDSAGDYPSYISYIHANGNGASIGRINLSNNNTYIAEIHVDHGDEVSATEAPAYIGSISVSGTEGYIGDIIATGKGSHIYNIALGESCCIGSSSNSTSGLVLKNTTSYLYLPKTGATSESNMSTSNAASNGWIALNGGTSSSRGAYLNYLSLGDYSKVTNEYIGEYVKIDNLNIGNGSTITSMVVDGGVLGNPTAGMVLGKTKSSYIYLAKTNATSEAGMSESTSASLYGTISLLGGTASARGAYLTQLMLNSYSKINTLVVSQYAKIAALNNAGEIRISHGSSGQGNTYVKPYGASVEVQVIKNGAFYPFVDVATTADMDTYLVAANKGIYFKYTGTTGKSSNNNYYVNGNIYTYEA